MSDTDNMLPFPAGPYQVVTVGNDEDGHALWIESKKHSLAEVFDLRGRGLEKHFKNPDQVAVANLFAAAPELYEALRLVVDEGNANIPNFEDFDAAQFAFKALAKARGESV